MLGWLNEGTLAISIILLTLAMFGFVFWHREIIYGSTSPGPRLQRIPRPPAPRRAPAPGPKPAETSPAPAETVSSPVSGIVAPRIDSETVSLQTIAKLVRAGLVTQTDALECVYSVNAGSSKRYTAIRDKYKLIAAQLDTNQPGPEASRAAGG